MTGRARRIAANCMLLTAGAVWGGGFVVMKNALASVSTNYLLAIRFTIGALGLCYTLFSRKHPVGKRALLGGLVTGALLYSAYAVQTYGLMYTTAGKNALITAVYVVLVPFLLWAVQKKRPDARTLGAALLMLAGIALLSLQSDMSVNVGDALTLACSIFYAVHILCVDKFAQTVDVMQLTCLQFSFCALFAWIAALCFETPPTNLGAEAIGALAYCGLAGTLLALTLMNVGIKYADPAYASLLLSTEAGFGCMFGVLFLNEIMTGRMWAGCALILLALVISQVDWQTVIQKRKSENDG